MARTAHSPSSSGGTSHSSQPLCSNLDESIKGVRQIADGRNDILAEPPVSPGFRMPAQRRLRSRSSLRFSCSVCVFRAKELRGRRLPVGSFLFATLGYPRTC